MRQVRNILPHRRVKVHCDLVELEFLDGRGVKELVERPQGICQDDGGRFDAHLCHCIGRRLRMKVHDLSRIKPS